jgi:hypothetical protein
VAIVMTCGNFDVEFGNMNPSEKQRPVVCAWYKRTAVKKRDT